MNINPKVRTVLIVSAKHAVAALLTNAGLSVAFHDVFNTHEGWWTFLKLVITVVGVAEGMYWGPRLLKWANSPTPGVD